MDTTSTDTKVCSSCGKEKPLEAFYRDGWKYKDGYKGQCKACYLPGRRRYDVERYKGNPRR